MCGFELAPFMKGSGSISNSSQSDHCSSLLPSSSTHVCLPASVMKRNESSSLSADFMVSFLFRKRSDLGLGKEKISQISKEKSKYVGGRCTCVARRCLCGQPKFEFSLGHFPIPACLLPILSDLCKLSTQNPTKYYNNIKILQNIMLF